MEPEQPRGRAPRTIEIRESSKLPWILVVALILTLGVYVFIDRYEVDIRTNDGTEVAAATVIPTEVPATIAPATQAPVSTSTPVPAEPTPPRPTSTAVPPPTEEPAVVALRATEEPEQDEPCRALDGGYTLDGMSSIASQEDGYLHVSVWTRESSGRAQPESEVLLSPGSYSVEPGTNGRVWELVGCTREEAEADVEAHISRRAESSGWGGEERFTRQG